MGVVALLAAAGYFARVRRVALGTLRDLAMNIMTGGTVKSGVLAFILHDLFLLQGVAVNTDTFAARERYGQRRVGVPVTVKTARLFKM